MLASVGYSYKKTTENLGRYKCSVKRRALDSNQRIPYDIGSLANCWFKPLTQPSLNHFCTQKRCKYTTYFGFCKILPTFFTSTYRNCLNISHISTPADTDTLSECLMPTCGISIAESTISAIA